MGVAGVVFTILFASKFHLSSSSTGDNTVLFRTCLQECRLQLACPTSTTAFGWTGQNCFSCRQNCVWKTVEQFTSFGQKVPQFFGKWPFQPVTFNFVIFSVLIQEPASTTFSLLNLLGVVRMLQRIQKTIPSDYRCFWVWKWFCYVGIFGWISSALFHSCDFLLTEYLDYLSACAIIVTSLFACVSFIFPQLQLSKSGRLLWKMFAFLCLGLYLWHVHYLTFSPRFDYDFNMKFCLLLSIATSVFYLAWTLQQYISGCRRPSLIFPISAICVGWIGASFEVFDFPPLFWVFDAHSIFHLCTIPVPWLVWYLNTWGHIEN